MPKVLIVEDNDLNLELVQHILDGNNIDWIAATSGSEAIETIKSTEVDLILMDLQMPEMDGFETFAEIRARLMDKTPPTIAVTGNAMEADRNRCMEDGFCDFVKKPFRVDLLLSVIRENLP